MDKSFPMISYAEVVKHTKCAKHVDSLVESTWFQQIANYEKETMSRSNSLSTILSDDTTVNAIKSNDNRHSISHSLDSGQVSDFSSDNETCLKSSTKCHDTCTEDEPSTRNVRNFQFQRRESVDSCHSSSSMCCSDHSCVSNHHVTLICQRWAKMRVEKDNIERDEGTLDRRQKQIDYGKNTMGYELYRKQIPKEKRTKDHPQTPNKHQKYSRRAFDGLIRIWRKQLHKFDPNDSAEADCSLTQIN